MNRSTLQRGRGRLRFAALLVTTGLLSIGGLAACGGSSSGESAAPTSSSSSPSAMATSSQAPQSSPSSSSSSGGTKSSQTTITIKNYKYHPDKTTVKPGATIKVVNDDNVSHTVTSDTKGAFNTGTVSAESSKTFTAPMKPKTYPYHCNFHSFMHGKLVVSG